MSSKEMYKSHIEAKMASDVQKMNKLFVSYLF